MSTPTLFGIEITDRISRLVAADCVEERGLTELAAALRETDRAVVLEPTDPPVMLPNDTEWTVTRHASGLLAELAARVGYKAFTLRFVFTSDGSFASESEPGQIDSWRFWHLDEFQRCEAYIHLDPFGEGEDYVRLSPITIMWSAPP